MSRSISRSRTLYFVCALFSSWLIAAVAHADETDGRARQVWQLLDYIAVDYSGAVSGGNIIEPNEYREMQDFALNVERQLRELQSQTASEGLMADARDLRALIEARADAAKVAEHARELAGAVQQRFPFPVAPTKAPDLQRGAQLYQANCASCHGGSGKGDGALSAKLEPKPTAFDDHSRARERSLFSLYQILSNGVEGTAMPSFASLSEDDRWALAFFVGTLSYDAAQQAAGEELWKDNKGLRSAMVGMEGLAQISEAKLASSIGDTAAAQLLAYLRSNPGAMVATQGRSAALAKTRLQESVAAFQAGNRPLATKLALSAYLDGFEALEPALAAKNDTLFRNVEKAMINFRATIAHGSLDDVRAAEAGLQALLDQTDLALAPGEGDSLAAFFAALTILVREGLEALLVVVAMLAFLRKADRPEIVRYVHAGWVAALAAGGLTWGVATYLVSISGASRELTEGFSSLFAAIVLLCVGLWMHQKSSAGRWQQYLKEKMSAAMTRRTAWFMASLAFVAVYREVFETVLFFAALWTGDNGMPLLAGLACGVVVLAVAAVVLLRTSARLPIGQFFAVSSLLVAALAIVLAGKGVAGLQEAGLVGITMMSIPRVDLLGFYPTLQTVLAQAAVLAIAIVGFAMNTRPVRAGKATGA
ncbi:cytochrome c/FTR1 family iron permease [Cupriavidus respiraculi]|uniref:Cytochrome c domain-containing protein n=1 Tax=Cupriavidus respiraculi TaxID=195930 RepID=A0ABM8XUC5_9BURK|nr:cytochrome c/FTR1 family iron permease [Cupriavidus respiraculi]MBY4949486.1 cytochrome c/FTR1 family iron permease [Cupriavidus respiraculi]CAG9183841.1 hypothetical protein LMG21510_04955 [Cupriavidus respiraculi]